MTQPGYVIITPVRNEDQHVQRTIDSVVTQTMRPQKWIIVNDGSTDGTGAIAEAAAKTHPWIQVVHRPDRGFRKSGGGVIEAFNDAFKLMPQESWDFLVKLDGDLSFESNYFEACLARFGADHQLGIGGGRIYCQNDGVIVEDSPGDPPFHVRGATKIYRRATWDAIGGLIQAPGWDTLDELKANMLGWKTYSFKELKVLQLKATGSADGILRGWFKNGLANYIVGYHPLFMLGKCAKRIVRSPVLLASLGLAAGYLSGYLRGIPHAADKELIRYIRRQQMDRLLLRESLWR